MIDLIERARLLGGAPSVASVRAQPPSADRTQGGSRSRDYQPGLPLVSVICICRNADKVMARCIESVAVQKYPNIEFIIYDGASTDGTLDILRKYDSTISFWASEPDRNRAEGFNKALAHATGDYLAALMADDWLAPDFVTAAVSAIQRHGTDYIIGDCMLHAEDGAPMYRRTGDPDFARNLPYWMTVNSPAFLIRRAMLDEIGLFNDILVASDYDWFLRAHIAGSRGVYDPSVTYHFRMGGVSTTTGLLAYGQNVAISRKYKSSPFGIAKMYIAVVARHFVRALLEALLPSKLVMSLRRLRQSKLEAKAHGKYQRQMESRRQKSG